MGDNYCAPGYASKPPMFRCASCATGFYLSAGACIRCPDSPVALVVAMALLCIPTFLNSLYYGPTYAAAQLLVRPQARAMATAVMVFAQNLIGLGLGPLFFGMMSDAFKPLAGAESVRWVLFGAAWLGLVPAFFFWRASLRLNREMAAKAALTLS